ncbi:MAG: hypothetical protein V7L23_12840 [Nostoc sp.]|uniref:hypothetical protein n=1 Tax=Nostoc sp. TaxID=1180 RepID=UPI002FF4053C
MFLFEQTNFDLDSPQSNAEVEELTESDRLSIEQGQQIQQKALEQEESSKNVQAN